MTEKITETQFWMVWNPGPYGRAPTYRHRTSKAARDEAERLAKDNPGQEFFVLKAVGGRVAKVPDPQPIKMVVGEDVDDGIPF